MLFLSPLPAMATPKVGVILPLSGDAASYGHQFQRGLNLAAQKSALEFIWEDSRFDSATALSAFQKLTRIDNVDFLISFGGATCQALNQKAQESKIIHLAAGCNTAEFKNSNSFNFRMDVNESIAAEKTVAYLKSLNHRSIAFLYINNSWAGTIVERTKAAALRDGLAVVAEVPFDSKNLDIGTSLARIRKARPDALFMLSLPDITAVVLRRINEAHLEVPLYSNISVENPEVIKQAATFADGIVYLSVKPDPSSAQNFPDFYKEFPQGNPFAAWGYDSVLLLSYALKQQHPQNALQQMKGFVGAFNSYTFNQQGELSLRYELREIENGEYHFKADV